MNDPAPHPIPPELQAHMDLEAQLKAAPDVALEQKVQQTVATLPGVEAVNFFQDRIAIRYDPESVSRAKLCDLLANAGCALAEVDNESSSPALEPEA